MKIYTKGGDRGETGLVGNVRVPKDHLRIQAYGTLDELNCALGLALAPAQGGEPVAREVRMRLERIQGELFQLGAELATPMGKSTSAALLGDAEITRLEGEIDEMEATLAPLRTFILPGGRPVAASLHLCRAISRRAERELVTLSRAESVRPEANRYLNRLSDYLFVSARFANHRAGGTDIPWIAPPA